MITWPAYLWQAAVAAGGALLVSRNGARLHPPVAANYRGRRLPVVLGMALTFGLGLAILIPLRHPFVRGLRSRVALVTAILLVFAAGLYDDRQATRVRGLTTHARALAAGRLTSGIVKLVASVLAAAIWALASQEHGLRLLLAIAVVAGCSNVWNLLDVAPGRALKYGLVAAAILFAVRPSTLVTDVAVASVVVLAPDVRERAMLGDSGATVLGFVLGVALVDRLATGALAGALVIILVVHGLAETFTLSRIIAAVAPLRWFDTLGRLPAPDEPFPAAE